MRRINIGIIILTLCIPLAGFSQKSKKKDTPADNPSEQKTITEIKEMNKEYTLPSGLKCTLIKMGRGLQAHKGDVVTVHYTGTLTDSVKTKFDSSKDRGKPFTFPLGAGKVIKGWDEGVALLHAGDVAILTIPPDLGYGNRATGKIPANSTLVFEIEILDVQPSPKMWDVEGLPIDSTPSGLKYIVICKGDENSPPPQTGKKVSVHYSGFLPDGKLFDSSVQRNQPFDFVLGMGQVIPGWDEGIARMHIGEKMRLIIPYNLAYGEEGRLPVIPPKATLIFDVELMDIQH